MGKEIISSLTELCSALLVIRAFIPELWVIAIAGMIYFICRYFVFPSVKTYLRRRNLIKTILDLKEVGCDVSSVTITDSGFQVKQYKNRKISSQKDEKKNVGLRVIHGKSKKN
jgi:hypothetical protein